MPPLTLAVLLLLLAAGPGAAALTSDAVHDLLVNYGLPPGLLPDAVTNYSLSDTGELEIDLARPCYVQFDELVHYDRHIRGQLTYGAISELTGIQRKKLLIWMSITGIVARVDVGTVEFQMGFLAEVVHAEIFEKVQVCRASSAGVNRELGLLPVAETTAMSPLTLAAVLLLVAAGGGTGASLNGAANEILRKYGLPRGLIPDSVNSYTFNETTGDFEIHLAGSCYIRFSRLVYYEKTIRGCLSYGAISGLTGIQAKKLFLWVSVTSIVAHPNDGTIEFKAGFVSEALPASEFDKVRVCGPGVGAQLRGAAGVIGELGLLPVAEA